MRRYEIPAKFLYYVRRIGPNDWRLYRRVSEFQAVEVSQHSTKAAAQQAKLDAQLSYQRSLERVAAWRPYDD